ncbi:hypothetical protein Tsubulata_011318 [Turnera subulata]|uniref:PGG domain-containing protein n=1 Tax=Turnera subulata TaxID=218843 RepID=A0A9Q0FUT8_9ROSI|nr:hypothetical protein Tsubulata_011318 [Turnera subulata]
MKFLQDHRHALTASISADGDTALHVAVLAGHVEIVGELVKMLDAEDLAITNRNNATALNYAAIGGITRIAEYLVEKNKGLLDVPNQNGLIPVVVASLYGHKEMVRYLYHESPKEVLSPERDKKNGLYPHLVFHQDSDQDTALDMLAQKPSAFPIPAIKHMYNLKLIHVQAHELLCCICQQISTLPRAEFEKLGVYKAVFNAVKNGIVEFITEMIKHYPDIIWIEDELERGIFLYATLQRQEKIFSLIYKMGAKKNSIATSWDRQHNNILHQAAFLAPSSQLDRVSGAALQMQRELQWYKEVEHIVQPKYREMSNMFRRTPKALFTESHRKLVEEGEKWMKDTAESCTVVAALIATIMFSAIFTVPGGYDAVGNPLYLSRNSFMVFIVSDAMSLFSSSSSLLMFLGILTSRYREEDFLKSLPTKLIVGLSCLFFSIATMMVTFGITLVIMLRERVSWVSVPIILLGSLPVTLFALLQFPLLVEIFYSTYGPGIFDKPKKWWLF